MPEIEDLPSLDAALRSARPLTGLRLQDLDLTSHEAQLLARTDLEGLVVLGGRVGRARPAPTPARGAGLPE